jgi:hypothetical protein
LKSILLIIILFIFVGCGADSPEMPIKEAQESETPHRPHRPEVKLQFGDSESPAWETRLEPGMTREEVLRVWGKPKTALRYLPEHIMDSEYDVWCYVAIGRKDPYFSNGQPRAYFAIIRWGKTDIYQAVWGQWGRDAHGENITLILGAINTTCVIDKNKAMKLYNYLYKKYWVIKF